MTRHLSPIDEHAVVALARMLDNHVLKRDDTFAVIDQFGDINSGYGAAHEQGLFYRGTRHLSHFALTVEGLRPIHLGSSVSELDRTLEVNCTTPTFDRPEGSISKETIHIRRRFVLDAQSLHEQLHLTNFGPDMVDIELSYTFDADFHDIFEVRGEARPARGSKQDNQTDESEVVITYEGLDGVARHTTLSWMRTPDELAESRATFRLRLEPRRPVDLEFSVFCTHKDDACPHASFSQARDQARQQRQEASQGCRIITSGASFNAWLAQASNDIELLTTQLPFGEYPYAGIPWYCTVFGRDGIIAALQTLWWRPAIAAGVLRCLAHFQAQEHDPERDEEPGKIIHEMRAGEMAALGEIPFGRYYGSIDATPLFVVLAGAYFQRTADTETLREIYPNIQRAIEWMTTYGDRDGDGFLEYHRKSKQGLANQAWKDSHDSVMHADGEPAHGPIAMCEVQGYAYAAWLAAAQLDDAFGYHRNAAEKRSRAEKLKADFDQAFWCDQIGTYALALDGEKSRCCVRTSNPGHCLFTGIVPEDHAPPSPKRSLPTTASVAGESALYPIAKPAITRCRTTTAASGLTTTPSPPPGLRAMASATTSTASRSHNARPPQSSPTSACRSYSVASSAPRAADPSRTPSHAHHRPGPPPLHISSSRRCWASNPTPSITNSASTAPPCPKNSPG